MISDDAAIFCGKILSSVSQTRYPLPVRENQIRWSMSEDGDREKRDTLIAHSSQVQNPLLYPCWAGTVGTVLTVTNTEISLKRLYFLLGPLSSVLCHATRSRPQLSCWIATSCNSPLTGRQDRVVSEPVEKVGCKASYFTTSRCQDVLKVDNFRSVYLS
jgi:hypothetical protein